MPADSRNLHEQERSIKAREHELYVKPLSPDGEQLRRPFPEYLRETPAEPLSAAIKTVLCIAGILVAIVFLAAIWRVIHRSSARSRNRPVPPAVQSAAVVDDLSQRLAIPTSFRYVVRVND
jgi:hypothetical protein